MSDAGWDLDRLGKAAADAVQPAPAAGSTLGKYRLIRELAGGAAGVVHEAEDLVLKRRVAVKVLREVHGSSDVLRHRFEREAQAAAGLDHPNVLRVFDAGEDGGRMYLVMELVDGKSLCDHLARRPFELRPMLRLIVKAARGVAAAHARGIVHRDVKPGNILVTGDGEPKVGDFGLARVLDSDAALTRTGTPLGTPLYMAPEQVRGDSTAIGPATDVYALGAILYEALTGRPPHAGSTETEIYGKILATDPVPPRRIEPKVPAELETICLKALDGEPSRRYATAKEFADDLDRHLNGESILAKPPGPVVRSVKWAKRHRTLTAVAGVTAAFLAVIFMQTTEALRRSRAETEMLKLLEIARPGLDKAAQGLYRADADLEELRRGVQKAKPALDKAVHLDAGRAVAHYHLGRAWELEGWDDRAEDCWRRAIRLEPTFGPALFRLGRLLAIRSFTMTIGYSAEDRARRDAAAKTLVDESGAMLEAAMRSGSGFDDLVQLDVASVLRVYLTKDAEKTREACLSAISRHGRAEGVEEFHWIHGWVTHGDESLKAYADALRLCPHHAWALACRGMGFGLAGRHADAEADYTAAMRINPRLTAAWSNRADVRIDLENFQGSIDDATEALKLDPRSVPALITRGISRRRMQDPAGAIADYAEAIGIDPELVTPWLNRANARLDQGDRTGAMADYAKAVALAPGSAHVLTVRGRSRRIAGDVEGALQDLTKAIDLDPSAADAWFSRGVMRAERGAHREAAVDLRKSLEIVSLNPVFRAEAERILKLIEPSEDY